MKTIPASMQSDGVDRDCGGESGHGTRAGRDTETKCLSLLKPSVPSTVPIHPSDGILSFSVLSKLSIASLAIIVSPGGAVVFDRNVPSLRAQAMG